MPCEICHDAVSREMRVDVRKASDIEKSADSCAWCGIILGVLNDQNINGNERVNISNDNNTSTTRATSGILILVSNSGQMHGSRSNFVVRSLKGLDLNSMQNVLCSGCVYTGSPLALKWAKSRIEECQSSHYSCKIEPHVIPDRVLWLGQGDTNDRDWLSNDVKLYESRGEIEPYATLSHKWGIKQPLRLLGANLVEFRVRIQWSSLPKTFQQAINFARRLNIRYLWIDSLCIIQDSAEDWEKQSAKMALIYEHSFITLAASVADNADAGCFQSPPPFLQGYVTDGISKARLNEGQALLDLMRASYRSTIAFVRGASEHPMPSEHLPLLKRGWVHQERLLSPRILHFGHVDLIFECSWCTECYCKKKAYAMSRSILSHPPKLQHANALGHGVNKEAGGHLNSYADHWCNIITRYSALDLTFESDRLPAIAGLAKQMARYMPEARYMSGVWTQRLLVYLPWRRNTHVPAPRGPSPRSGPSWTWVTMPGGVSFPAGYFYSQGPVPGFWESSNLWAEVVSITFDHQGDEDFMSLKDGTLTLRGFLVEARLRRLETRQRSQFGIIPSGSKAIFSGVTLDHEPEEIELQDEWDDMTPAWAMLPGNPPLADLSTAQSMDWTEELGNEFPLHTHLDPLLGVLQHKQTRWAFCLGVWQTDPGSTDQYLLLESLDKSSQTFRRIGQGGSSAEKSAFRDISQKEVIILK